MTPTGGNADRPRRPAVLLDRDGTLTEHRHYPAHPDELALQPDIGAPLRALQEEGFALVVVTNQSGVARGLLDATVLDAMHDRLRALLGRQEVRLDAIYACPHHPEGTVPRYRLVCRCRKPAPGMLLQAARDLDLDLARSWMVGDSPRDVEAGHRAGTRTARVGPGLDGGVDPEVTGATTSEVLRHMRLLGAVTLADRVG
ncbi:D-glycero-beta-D-manno-heptose-1,7-bisphosphate 7-phosphatase [Streptomyces sp. ADI92-24]|uniref:D-glycero-alpha-D-manno-heptose-1,7-bisphosphate 7-phosphatase n=1 Tax=unclassified Streptomyces TaxID=2593676 RepID=UPI000F4619F2|nr:MULTISPECIES: HAD family hydrolase [unclassified Streptomyces]ROQ78316.1 D-glycero-D-manno-heptose 1,7-bisphosphate phosphatase [Streptomyces sp. CEV 2-1]RPK37335.1 D-glycero-beta-D-manno-heptose-1,7-bisphosphate 7-phosphatase [Streptomyces sp. ADI92-24]